MELAGDNGRSGVQDKDFAGKIEALDCWCTGSKVLRGSEVGYWDLEEQPALLPRSWWPSNIHVLRTPDLLLLLHQKQEAVTIQGRHVR